VSLLSGKAASGNLLRGLEVLRARSEHVVPIGRELVDAARSGRLSIPPERLAESYVHMQVNRLLRSAQRAHELVLYDFLDRCYESADARTRSSAQPAEVLA
jgi:thiopeptide-type bacteriocin biosynthesis protein